VLDCRVVVCKGVMFSTLNFLDLEFDLGFLYFVRGVECVGLYASVLMSLKLNF